MEGYPSRVDGQFLASPGQRFPEISQLVIASGYRIRTTILLATLLAAISGGVAFCLVPAQYLATATVRILQREGYLLTTQQSRAEDAAFVRAQETLVSQEQTLAQALKDSELSALTQNRKREDQIVWLRQQIKTEISVGSEAMTITASNPSADIAVHASRAVTEAYLAVVTEQLRASRDRRIHELEYTAKEVDAKLMLHWSLLQSKAGKIGSGNPQTLSVNEQLKLQNHRENSQRLRTLQFQRSQIELQLNAERNVKLPTPESPELQILAAIGQHPEVIALREQVRQFDVKIQEMKELVQSNSAPQLVRLQNERDFYVNAQRQAEAKVDSMERKKHSRLASETVPSLKVKGLEDQLMLIDQELVNLRETATQLESSIIEASGPSGVELEIIRHEIEREERLADNLWKTIQELRIEERAEPRVTAMAFPSSTNKMSRSKQLMTAAAASFLGLIVAILGVGYFEWSSFLIRRPDDVANRLGIHVFGASGFSHGIHAANELAAQLLLHANSDGSLPSVWVTSATQAEPRGRLSVELCEAIAASGRRVLHVTCDCGEWTHSKPSIADLHSGKRTTGWSERIRSSTQHGFDYLTIEEGQEYLTWIACHSLPKFLQDVKQRYDSIVVLGPAVLTNSESVLLASKVDFTILAVVLGQTRIDLLLAARNRLQLSNSKILAALSKPGLRSTRKTDLLLNSQSDPFVVGRRCMDEEEEVLAQVKDLQASIDEIDADSSPVSASCVPSTSRQNPPSSRKSE